MGLHCQIRQAFGFPEILNFYLHIDDDVKTFGSLFAWKNGFFSTLRKKHEYLGLPGSFCQVFSDSAKRFVTV